jgi:hypothetical protein
LAHKFGVGFLIVICTAFRGTALKPRLINTVTSLHLPENTAFWGRAHIYRYHQQRDLDRHYVLGAYNLYVYTYNFGSSTESCGTPVSISIGVDVPPSTETLEISVKMKGANKLD